MSAILNPAGMFAEVAVPSRSSTVSSKRATMEFPSTQTRLTPSLDSEQTGELSYVHSPSVLQVNSSMTKPSSCPEASYPVMND